MDALLDVRKSEVTWIHLDAKSFNLIMISISIYLQASVFFVKFPLSFIQLEYVSFSIFNLLFPFIDLGRQLIDLLEGRLIQFSLKERLFSNDIELSLQLITLYYHIC